MNGTKKYSKKRFVKKSNYRRRFTTKRRNQRNDDTTNVKIEYSDEVIVPNGTSLATISGLTYMNIKHILSNSTAWLDVSARYARYKINGLQIRYDTCSTTLPATLPTDFPISNFAFFPQSVSGALGDAPYYNDKKFTCNPSFTSPQSKYWSFPDGYFSASSGGYGTWNNVTDYSTIIGQVSTYNFPIFAATADTRVAIIRFTLYVTMSSKNF